MVKSKKEREVALVEIAERSEEGGFVFNLAKAQRELDSSWGANLE